MNAGIISPARVALIAGQTFREAVRQRLLGLLLAMLAASAGVALVLRDFHFGTTEQKFVLDAGFGAEALFGSILAIAATAQLFLGEIERRTVLMVLAKPVRRAEFVVGKLGGVLLLLLVFCAALTALLIALVWAQGRPWASAGAGAALFGGIALCGFVQWLELSVLAAATLLIASFARSSLFAVMTAFAVLVAGHLHPLARDFYAATGPGWAAAGARLLSWVLPDFRLFDVADRVAGGPPLSAGVIAGIAGYGIAYLGGLSALAVWCFHRREL